MNKPVHSHYTELINSISQVYLKGQRKTIATINAGLVLTYWEIGQNIVVYEQKGKETAEYGKKLLENLSKDLKIQLGRGFSLSNFKRFRQFYLTDPIGATVSHQLSWSHHVELLKISNQVERQFNLWY